MTAFEEAIVSAVAAERAYINSLVAAELARVRAYRENDSTCTARNQWEALAVEQTLEWILNPASIMTPLEYVKHSDTEAGE